MKYHDIRPRRRQLGSREGVASQASSQTVERQQSLAAFITVLLYNFAIQLALYGNTVIPSDELAVLRRSRRSSTPTYFRLATRSLRAAEIQIGRIWSRDLKADSPDKLGALAEDVLIDVHFYFIALRDIYRFLRKIVDDPAYAHLSGQLEEMNKRWFKHYAGGREAFEHIDQRLPGEKYPDRLIEIEEAGAKRTIHYGLRMGAGLFLHSDKSWDISAAGFEELAVEVRTFLHAVVSDPNPSGESAAPVV